MEVLVSCLCRQGKLSVTYNSVILEPVATVGGFGKRRSIARQAIVGVDSKQTVPSVFGFGGAVQIILHTNDGRHVKLDAVPPKPARKIVQLLG